MWKLFCQAGYKPGEDVFRFGCSGYRAISDGLYHLKGEGLTKNAEEMVEFYEDLCRKYPVISIEDGLAEDDWTGWQKMTAALGDKVQIVGDDLLLPIQKE